MRFLSVPSSSPSTSTGPPFSEYILTSSKDTFLKLWDLTTQHCVQTIVAHSSEIWTLDVNKDQDLVFTGSGEGELKAWRIDHKALREGLTENEAGEVGSSNLFIPVLSELVRSSDFQNHPLCHVFAPFFSPSCLPTVISPDTALPCRPVA